LIREQSRRLKNQAALFDLGGERLGMPRLESKRKRRYF